MIADELRARLRADLVAAMRAREPDAVSALRTALAAVDNAEAVEAAGGGRPPVSEHVAGASAGVGSTEARRRVLTTTDVLDILRAQQADAVAAAAHYEELGQPEAAGRLRRQAGALAAYLDG